MKQTYLKKTLIMLLITALTVTAVPIRTKAAVGSSISGSGTSKNPYQITCEADLREIRNAPDAQWKLMNDVTLESAWIPIEKFTGTLDGNGHTVSDMEISGNASAFILTNSGTIRNLNLEGNVSARGTENSVSGALLVYNNQDGGEIEKCAVSGTITLTANKDGVFGGGGGLVSSNSGKIVNCYAKVNFLFKNPQSNRWSMHDTADSIGGFVGYNGGTVTNCYAVCAIKFDTEGGFLSIESGTGRFCGSRGDGDTLSGCYFDPVNLYCYNAGSERDTYGYERDTQAMKKRSTYAGWDFGSVWAIDETVNDGYPYLRKPYESNFSSTGELNGKGTASAPYEIYDAADLEMINVYRDAYWKLMDNVTLEDKWYPVGEFTGTLDGDGYTVYGVDIYSYDDGGCGFFQTNMGIIKNLNLEGEMHTYSENGEGGFLAYHNKGTIENCSVSGTVTVGKSYNNKYINVGGFVCYNGATIRNCYAKVSFDLDSRTVNIDTDKIGGFVSHDEDIYLSEPGVIENCYSVTNLLWNTMGNSQYAGVFCQSYGDGTSTGCYYNTSLIKFASAARDAYAKRMNTESMQKRATYAEWDFDDIWAIDEAKNDGYPYLQIQKFVKYRAMGIKLDRTKVTLKEGETITLHANILPEEAMGIDRTVTWESSNNYAAKVNNNGIVTAVAEEDGVTITATSADGKFTAQCVVDVKAASAADAIVDEVVLSPDKAEAKQGEKIYFSAAAKGLNLTDTSVIWTVTGNKSTSTVITDGTLNIASDETASHLTVTALSKADAGKSKSAMVTVLKNASGGTSGSGEGGSGETGEEGDTSSVVEETYGDWTYKILENGTAAITGYTGTDKEVDVPAFINGKIVTVIDDYALGYLDISKVTLPVSVKKIGSGAFTGCESLTDVTMLGGVTEIGDYAFFYCIALTSISLPDSVKTLGKDVFSECSSLVSVTLPKKITEISEGIFGGCTKLAAVEIPDGVTRIAKEAFRDCGKLADVGIPDSLTDIESSAFNGCSSLSEIYLPADIKSIDYFAFYNMGLTTVYYGGTEEQWGKIDIDSLNGSLDTAEIRYNASNPKGGGGTGEVSEDCFTYELLPDGTISITGYTGTTGNITIPDSIDGQRVTEIAENAFATNKNLTNVEISNSVTKIGNGAFALCTNLTTVKLPDGIAKIPETAFYSCGKLTTVNIPYSVDSIGDYAFYDCVALEEITAPDELESIGENAFYGCSKLVIYGTEGSYAQTYAKANNISFRKAGTENQKPAGTTPPTSTNNVMKGDVTGNQKVDLLDAKAILKYSLAIDKIPSEAVRKAADVNEDSKVDLNDAKYVLKYALGIITELPATK